MTKKSWCSLLCAVLFAAQSLSHAKTRRANDFRLSLPELKNSCVPNAKCAMINPEPMFKSSYFHMVVGTDHPMAFHMLAHQICIAISGCFEPTNFRLVLHSSESNEPSRSHFQIVQFLDSLNITFEKWTGTFSPDEKMKQTYSYMQNATQAERLIYHTDVDEVPDPVQLAQALFEFQSGHCDAITGYWKERVSPDGSLNRISLNFSESLEQQFPLRCDISENVVGGGHTRKTIAYRANYRVDGGQHDVWCDRDGRDPPVRGNDGNVAPQNSPWNKTKACMDHIISRAKGKHMDAIMSHLIGVHSRPRYCPTLVTVDHYKFIYGLRKYLTNRVKSYKKQALHWWRDSAEFLQHMNKHGGKVCVDCAETKCFDTIKRQRVEVNSTKAF